MKTYLSTIITFGVLVAVLSFATAPVQAQSIQLELEWARLGDSQGAVGEESGSASVESAEFSPDGTLIVSGAKGRVVGGGERKGQAVALWRAEDGEKLWSRPRANEVEAVAFSPNGQLVAAGGEDDKVEILRVRRGGSVLDEPELVSVLEHAAAVDGLRFSPDGRVLATGVEDQHVYLWRTSDWERVAKKKHGGIEDEAVNQLDFTSDGRYMATAGTNSTVRLWKLEFESGAEREEGDVRVVPVRTLQHGGSVKSVRFSPDDHLLAAGAGKGSGVKIWTIHGNLVEHLNATGWLMEAVVWTPDGSHLLTGGNEGEADDDNGPFTCGPPTCEGFGYIRGYNRSEKYALTLSQRTYRQEYLHFDREGERLVSSHEDGALRLWTVTYRE